MYRVLANQDDRNFQLENKGFIDEYLCRELCTRFPDRVDALKELFEDKRDEQ
jgi:hypothetical protein